MNGICGSTMTFSLQLCTRNKVVGCILKTIQLFPQEEEENIESIMSSYKLSTSNLRQSNKYIYKTVSGISRLTWALAAWPLHNKIYFRFHFLIGYDIAPEISNGLDEERGFEIDKATNDHGLTLDVWVSKSGSLILSHTVVMKHLPWEPRSHSLWIAQWFDATLDLYQPITSPVPVLYCPKKKNLQNRFRQKGQNMTVIWR